MSLIKNFTQSNFEISFLRFLVIILLIAFGTTKFFEFEVQALIPLISKTYLNFLYDILGHHKTSYFLGIFEAITYICLFIGYYKPKFGVLGAVLAIIMSLTTLSLMIQAGFDFFIFKDILLFGASLVILKHDLKRSCDK